MPAESNQKAPNRKSSGPFLLNLGTQTYGQSQSIIRRDSLSPSVEPSSGFFFHCTHGCFEIQLGQLRIVLQSVTELLFQRVPVLSPKWNAQ